MIERVFLVVLDESAECALALRYACDRAKAVKGRVALLSVVESQGIETWGGVERALDDAAFDQARAVVAAHTPDIVAQTGAEPLAYYQKGEPRQVLLQLLAEHQEISILVLAAQTREGASNPLIHYLTSDKGLRHLPVPVIIVTDACRDFLA